MTDETSIEIPTSPEEESPQKWIGEMESSFKMMIDISDQMGELGIKEPVSGAIWQARLASADQTGHITEENLLHAMTWAQPELSKDERMKAVAAHLAAVNEKMTTAKTRLDELAEKNGARIIVQYPKRLTKDPTGPREENNSEENLEYFVRFWRPNT